MGDLVSIGSLFPWAAWTLGILARRRCFRFGFHAPKQGADVDFFSAMWADHSRLYQAVG
jgi:hypothetical protein